MQTFLPYPDDRASAAVLDDRRLGKQRVECLQVLRALTYVDYGWRNHPAVRMWRGFVPALVAYSAAVCDEWVARGRADAVKEAVLAFTDGVEPDRERLVADGQVPPWLGLDAVHQSHRSALVRKDPEHYRRWFPDVPDDLPYVWPRASFPRWPLRRGGPDALPLQAALDLVGVDALPDGWDEVLAELGLGRSQTVVGDPDPLPTLGVLAGLVTPGRTVWVSPGDPLPPVSPRPPAVAVVTGSAVSPSIARPPTDADLAQVAREAAAAGDPEFRFLRPHQLGEEDGWADVGLVVVDPGLDALPRLPGGVPVLRLRSSG
ncbi:MSMEG_6728 family protein [Aquipuribacter nitratireducens]|uniref:MSMEG_6728 family protein n=1 Tax=Aquipuribacter nitratireducens TaxID=650104 RepID=A0ABW0GND0_9MICO